MKKNNNKEKDLRFLDSLTLPKGQPFSKLLTGKLKDTDGDKIPDAFDCDPNDKDKDGIRDWLKRRKERRQREKALEKPLPSGARVLVPEGKSGAVAVPISEIAPPKPTPTPTQTPTKTGGGRGGRSTTTPTPTPTPTPTFIAPTTTPTPTPTGGVSRRSSLEQFKADQQRKQREQSIIQRRLEEQARQKELLRQQLLEREARLTKFDDRGKGVSVGDVVTTSSAELEKELDVLKEQEKQIDKMSISDEEKKKLKKEIRQKKSTIRKVKRGERLDKPIEVNYIEQQFGTVTTEAPRGYKEVTGEITRRELLEAPLATLAAPAKAVEKTLEVSKTGWQQLLSGGEGTEIGGIGLGLAPTKEVERTIFTPQFGTIQTDPITGKRLSGITEEKVMVEQKTFAGILPGAITGAAGLGLYAVPGVGEGLLVSETAKATETLIDPTATEEEKKAARIEGAIASAFIVGGGVLKLRKFKKDSVSKELTKELDKLEEATAKEFTIVKKGEGTKAGSDKVVVKSIKETDNFIQETITKGDFISGKDGKLFFPEGTGTSVIKGKFKPTLSGEKAFIETQVFEVGAKGQSIKLKNIGDAKVFTQTGTGTFIPVEKAAVIISKPKGLFKSAKKSVKTKYSSGGDIVKAIETPGESKQIMFNKKFGLTLGEKRAGTILITEKKAIEGQLGFRATGKKTPFSKTFGKEEVILKDTQLITNRPTLTPKTSAVSEQVAKTESDLFFTGQKAVQKGLRKQTEKTIIGLGLSSKVVPKIRTVPDIKIGQKQFRDTLSSERSVLGQDTALGTDLTQSQNPLFDSIQDVSVKQQPIERLKDTQDFFNNGGATQIGLRPTTPTPTIPTPPEIIKPIIVKPKKKPKLVSGQGYNVSVKKFSTDKNKMTWQKLNTKPVTQKSALGLGAEETDQTISASFRIKKAPIEYEKIKGKKTKTKKKIIDLGTDYYDENIEKFRETKIRKGKELKTTGTFIEKAKYRLDTQQEKRQIQQAPRPVMLSAPGENITTQQSRVTTRRRSSVPLIGFGEASSLSPRQEDTQQPQQSGLARLGNGIGQVQNRFDRFNGAMSKVNNRIKVNISPRNRTKKGTGNKVSIFTRR